MEQLVWILLGIVVGAGAVAGIGFFILPKMVASRTSTFEETVQEGAERKGR